MAADPGLHSRIVGVLKVGLPLVALGMLASLFLVQTDDRLGGDLVFSPGDIDALGEGLRITNPTFTGTTRGEDRFRFTAGAGRARRGAARAGARSPTLAGEVDLHDGPVVELEADDRRPPHPDPAARRRRQRPHPHLRRLPDATPSRRRSTSGPARSSPGNAVETTGPLGAINSGSLHVAPAAASGEARRFSFGNGVRLVYDPPDTG